MPRCSRSLARATSEAKRLLSAHRKQLDALVEALLARETLNEQEILEVTGLPRAPALETRMLPVSMATAALVTRREVSESANTLQHDLKPRIRDSVSTQLQTL